MACRKLWIYPDEKTAERHEERSRRLVLESVVDDVTEQEANELYGRLVNLNVDSEYDLPVYEILHKRIWRNRWQNTPGREYYATELLIPKYEMIRNEIEQNDIDRVHPVELSRIERTLVADIARSTDCGVVTDRSLRWRVRCVGDQVGLLLRSLIGLFVVLLDQLFSALLSPLFASPQSRLLVVFSAGRPQTTEPLLDAMDGTPDVLFGIKTVSYLLDHSDTMDTVFGARPIHTHATLRSVLSSLRLALALLVDLAYQPKLACSLTDAIEESEGVRLERTSTLLLRYAVLPNMEAIMMYPIACRLFESHEYDAMLIPHFARKGKVLAHARHSSRPRIYKLPHSVLLQQTPYEVTVDQTIFTAGDLDAGYAREFERITPIVTGYVKHLHIRDVGEELSSRQDIAAGEADSVVVATQAYPDRIRRTFVRTVVGSFLSETDLRVVLKPHPGETAEFYERLISELGYDESGQVTVVDQNLYEHIYRSELVVTIASNVAIEALILDTPAVCYNRWKPFLRTPLFVKYGAIPQAESPDEFRAFVASIDPTALLRRQQPILVEDYRIQGNSVERITERITTELQSDEPTGSD